MLFKIHRKGGLDMTLQSARQRQKDTNYLIQRDGGICLYCNQKLDFQDYKNPVEIDHLEIGRAHV